MTDDSCKACQLVIVGHQFVCCYCGELRPFGPARDTSEVLIEIRAAELALTSHGWTPDEISGGYICSTPCDGYFYDGIDNDEQSAGYLAEVIRRPARGGCPLSRDRKRSNEHEQAQPSPAG